MSRTRTTGAASRHSNASCPPHARQRRTLLSLQRGDIDAAFNLIPEQVVTLNVNKDIWINRLISTDFVYLALTSEAAFNKALGIKQARQAIG